VNEPVVAVGSMALEYRDQRANIACVSD
jgi:hypothetical protein